MTKNLETYTKRFETVCDYIYRHLDEPLTVQQLSVVAHLSKFHFHRQFSAFMGMSLTKYIQLLRLKRASYQLVFNQDIKIIDIALNAGFENPESFSRAFKVNFKQTPTDFRLNPKWQPWHQIYQFKAIKQVTDMKVNIINFEATKIAVLEHRGDAKLLNDSIAQFIAWRKSTQLSPIAKMRTFGLAYDDPATTQPEDFRFDIGGEVTQNIPDNDFGVMNKTIPSGKCAVVVHKGSRDLMDDKVRYLYGTWVVENGESLRDFPCFFEHKNFFPAVAEHELITTIYLPLL